ncbi:MAG: CHC2 zinc finger domain-containing protein [Ignavibacteriales bacterium]
MKSPFELIRESILVRDVALYHGIEFSHSGKARCPFHGDDKPSFSLHPSGGYAYCFGCSVSADAIELEFKLGLYGTRWEALKSLNERYSLGLKFNDWDKEKAEEISNAYQMIEKFCIDAHKTLMANAELLNWLKEKKGLTVEGLKKYCIGYVGDGRLTRILKGKERELALKIGLLAETDGKVYDYFRYRIPFPIYNRGKIVGIWARRWPDKDGAVKYIGLPCSEFMPHKPIAFGENLNCDRCVVVESISDAIAFIKVDIPACSPVGTEISRYQSLCFEKAKAKLYFSGDPDSPGEKASYKWARRYKGYAIDLGFDKDPDAVIAEVGIEEFKKIAERAIGEAKHYIDVVIEKESLSDAIDEIAKLEDASGKDGLGSSRKSTIFPSALLKRM